MSTDPNRVLADPDRQAAREVDMLYRRYGTAIRQYLERRFGKGPPDPEDAVQAAFERFARLGNPREILDPGAFLRRSARNFVIDYHRAQKVRNAHTRSQENLETDTDDLTAERVLSAREPLAIIDQTIRNMDERRRSVLIMNRIQGMNCAEIARALGCSPTLVKMRLAEAVALCQRALRDADGEG
ncbi:ECF subfamily RNA polymerase sigma-24 factor [Novosphingobium nitrogenifigens DSM 19370]|uniref:ECF subfamily RNA polymerase sigma-24 factor n=1 Tax=Novosphingobium nitrogenifigens DSM 19370 TaxID=983920 RepID=F1ZB36_9SPHN|nr:sigma-70 family RNA polymerase sigma factor [Novosphingobium nitrogenifigens]EGD58097.1 ECF subfamily RNA polymerase sigma-24 factor [Novosphingobium nitrogenifigens DSM 19370]